MAEEAKLETKLRNLVKGLGGIAIKFFVLSFTGFPDRIVLLPGGRIWFVEVKAPGKKPSPRQRVVHRMLVRLGFEVWVIDSNEILERFKNRIA